jgi:starch phosphorylase
VDPHYRDREEAQELLDILEKQVLPLYYARNGHGYSEAWVHKSKSSMKSLIPRFNAQRMVVDYVRNYYTHARKQRLVMAGNQHARAKEVATWRRKLEQSWPKVRLRRLDAPLGELRAGNVLSISVAADLNGLSPEDVLVECLVGTENESGEFVRKDAHVFTHTGPGEHGETVFRLDLEPRLSGLQFYKIRLFPFHPCLSHRFETGYMIWL